MKLRTRLNLVVAGLTVTFVVVLIGEEIRSTRLSLREEIAAGNRVASQLLGGLAAIYSREGGADQVHRFLDELGRVRANDITLESEAGEVLYRSPPATYKAGRAAPEWFSRSLAPDAERQELARIVDQRIEEERRAIAHELHDEFGQSVTAIRALAQAIAVQAGTRDATTRETAELISSEAARLYDNMHGLIPRLTPLALDTLGLAATLENLVRDWQRRFPAVALTVRHEIPSDLGPSIALAIYRVAQEGLINALRHGQPKSVDVAVSADPRRIAVRVRDDGVGLAEDWSRAGHFGLRGLAERVAQLGGTFAVANAAYGGVELTAEIPLEAAA